MSKVFEDFVKRAGRVSQESSRKPVSDPFSLLVESGDPSLFRVAFDLSKSGVIQQLKAGKLEGMVGISANREIRFDWLGIGRDALLIMKSNEVLKNNDIEPIAYDDYRSLLRDDMKELKRIVDSRRNESTLTKIFQHTSDAMRDTSYGREGYALKSCGFEIASNIGKSEISTLGQLLDKFLDFIEDKERGRDYILLQNLGEITWKNWLIKGILDIGKLFSTEGEWGVRDTILRIPKGSVIVILTFDTSMSPAMQDLFNTHKSKNPDATPEVIYGKSGWEHIQKENKRVELLKRELGSRYKLKFLFKTAWDKQQGDYFTIKTQRAKRLSGVL